MENFLICCAHMVYFLKLPYLLGLLKSCSLIDQIYSKFPNPNFTFAPIVVKSRISDHCQCVNSINLLQPKVYARKFIKIRRLNEDWIEMFKIRFWLQIWPKKSYLRVPLITTFNFTYTSSDEVYILINNLKPKQSTAHDSISSQLLKDIGHMISPTLSVIINQSLYTGIFPKQLKISKIIPLLKKGEETSIENYSPISLLSSISKVFISILDVYNLLFDSQCGFRKQHSTELAALEIVDRIHKNMDNGLISCIHIYGFIKGVWHAWSYYSREQTCLLLNKK